MDYDNHMLTDEIPEYATESDEARKQRIANECDKMLQECDPLDVFLEAPITEMHRRAIQVAISEVMDEGVFDDFIIKTFKRDFRQDFANFAVWVDTCIRGKLPSWMRTMTALEIGHAIEAAVDDEILRIVEGRQ
ncbi:MAG: hypothetical protein R3183_14505 [Oleiphilaceae bacterium]|nr:hypothetical protein [Oleiphilaceae bacterium]